MTDDPTKYDSVEQAKAREAGPGVWPDPPVGDLPAGEGLWPVPHHLSKVSLINQHSRSYRWSYDEALQSSRESARAMLRDVMVTSSLAAWMIPVSQLSWHLEPRDETDPKQLAGVQLLTAVIEETPRLTDLFHSLLFGEFLGRQGVAQLFEWKFGYPDGKKRLLVKNHRPIHGDSLVARWDGQWGQLVNGLYEGKKEATDIGFAHFYTPAEREAVIVHYAPPFDVDFYDPELAGQIRGWGLRGQIFWSWWLRSNFLALVADYGERFANGLWKAYYDVSNPNGKTEMENVLIEYRNSKVLNLPQNPDGRKPYDVVVESVPAANPQFLLELINGYFDNYIRDYLSGASLSHGSELNVGGDGVQYMQNRVTRAVKWYANRLAETLTEDWLPVLTKYNCGESAVSPYFRFDVDSPNAEQLIANAKILHDIGVDVDVDHLRVVAGLPIPNPGSNVASKLQPLSPTAVNQTPQQTPMVGPAGPQQVQDQAPQPAPVQAQAGMDNSNLAV